MLARLLGSLALGLTLSVCGGGLIAIITALTNLPRILTGLTTLLRFALSISYYIYAWLLAILQPILRHWFGIDLLTTSFRTMSTLVLSLSTGWGLLLLLDWQISIWWLLIFSFHGLLVGLAWEQLIQPNSFQLGERTL